MIRLVFGGTGIAFLLVAIVRQWSDVRTDLHVQAHSVAVSVILTGLSLAAHGRAWSSLLPDSVDPRRARRIYYLASPAKYIPGGFAQSAGQIGLTASDGVPPLLSAAAFVVHAVAIIASASLPAAVAGLFGDIPGWVRLAAVASPVSCVLLWRRGLVAASRLLGERGKRLSAQTIPAQTSMLAAFRWSLVGTIFAASAFVGIAAGSVDSSPLRLGSAFALAFLIGYLAIPVPAGIGIREASLALAVPGLGLPTAIALSGLHRLVTMAVELIAVAATTRIERPRRRE